MVDFLDIQLGSVWTMEQFKEAAKGRMLVPVSLAASLTGISRQRLYFLIHAGRIHRVMIFGQTFVDLQQAHSWYRLSLN